MYICVVVVVVVVYELVDWQRAESFISLAGDSY